MNYPGLLLLSLLGLTACSGGAPEAFHDDPDLLLISGRRVDLRTDLTPEQAEPVLTRLDALEEILDAAFPFLAAPPETRARSLVLADPGRFAWFAREHELGDANADAFVCQRGELYLRFRPADWAERWAVGPPYPLEPRVRPLAAAAVSRRLSVIVGPCNASWLEEGLRMVFVDLAAQEFGDEDLALRVRRERLLDAYIPLYLGAPPALAEVVTEPMSESPRRRRTGSRALAWAAVRYLLTDPELTALLGLGLRRAAGEEVPTASWESGLARLKAEEREFERFLRGAVLRELLATFLEAPTAVDRWESASALRLLANLDINPEADEETRHRLAGASAQLLDDDPLPARFLDEFAAEIAITKGARSRIQALNKLQRHVEAELERRAAGYGHPAVEAARMRLGKALRRALDQS